MKTAKKQMEWHDLISNPDDTPELGERVIICVGYHFVGEGYLKQDGKWYRYCDFEPLEQYMSQPVTGWMPMPAAQKRPKTRKGSTNATERPE